MLVIKRGSETLATGLLADAIVSRLEINGATLIEEGECVRADAVTIFDRGNKRNQVSFTIGKLHDSQIEAEHHRLTHAQDNLGRDDLVIELTENGTTYTATLANAGWRSIAPKRTGVYTMTDYEVVGGRFTTTNAPTPSADTIDGGLEGTGFSYDDDVDGGHAGDSAGCFVETIAGSTP